MRYIWQDKGWPTFRWSAKALCAAAGVWIGGAFADERIVAVDQASTSAVIIAGNQVTWRWTPQNDPNVRPADCGLFAAIDECKVCEDGATLFVNASCGGVAAIDIAKTNVIWYARASRGNAGPHSVCRLPDGRIAVANSTGCDALEIIDIGRAPLDPARQTLVRAAEIPGAHGVEWNVRRHSLFVLGYTNLYEFAYLPEKTALVELRRWRYDGALGDAWGHDLVPDGKGGYFMTNHAGVWRIDPETGVFSHVLARKNAKSFSRDSKKGDLVQLPTERWWSDRLIVVGPDGKDRIVGPFPGAKFYKARWFSSAREYLAAEPPTELVVAAANARSFEKAKADLVCTGTNDERVINAAIARLTRGGTIRLADGDYAIDAFEQEGGSAILFGYNDGHARVITLKGTTENKGYNTRFGVTLHVTKKAMDSMDAKVVHRVFYGAGRKPNARGDFFTYTHVNNVNFTNFFIFFDNAAKRLIGIDGRNFGSMELDLIGIYQKSYFDDRFLHIGAPSIPCEGTVGVYSLPTSNDEMARGRYNEVNVGGLYRGFVFDEVDHLVMTGCCAARCVYGYWFEKGGPKTLTMINCCDEGNTHLPHFGGKGHLTAIDFNVERFTEKFIPRDPTGNTESAATESEPGAWRGFISYTLQGTAFGLGKGSWNPARFWKDGHGRNIRTVDLNAADPQKVDSAASRARSATP